MRRRLIPILATAVGVAAAAIAITIPRTTANAAVLGGFNFNAPQVAATGLQIPWGLAFLPDGSALVSERATARVLRVRPGQTPTQVTTVNGVNANGEGGLLGLAVSPNFAS